MKITKRKIIVIAAVALIALGYYTFQKRHTPYGAEVVMVQTAIVKESSLPLEATAIGTVVAAQSVEITSEVAGHVAKVLFQDGTFVKANTVLIQLDDAVYTAKNASARAQLIYSDNNYKRMVLLGKQGAIARQAIDQSEADLKEKRANASESQVMVDKMKLIAPFDGVVGKSRVSVGDYVNVGQSLVTLTDTKHLHVEYNVPEKFLPLLKMGQKVQITSSTYPNRKFVGTVTYIAPTINTDNRSVSMYAELDNESGALTSGMFVNVAQSLGSDEKVLMLPARSLVPIMDGEQVFKVVNGKAYPVTVVTGRRANDKVQIMQGLAPGDQVITDGQLKVKNGSLVKTHS